MQEGTVVAADDKTTFEVEAGRLAFGAVFTRDTQATERVVAREATMNEAHAARRHQRDVAIEVGE